MLRHVFTKNVIKGAIDQNDLCPAVVGLAMELDCTLPMLLAYLVVFKPANASEPTLASTLLHDTLGTGLSGEALFRDFLSGQLYRLSWLRVLVATYL